MAAADVGTVSEHVKRVHKRNHAAKLHAREAAERAAAEHKAQSPQPPAKP